MKVNSIELLNIRSYPNVKLDLSNSINLLVGANNSGKSTIIKCLLNLQYRNFFKRDIRSTLDYAKIFTKIVDVDAKDNLRFKDPKRQKEFEESTEFTVLWGSAVTNDDEREEHVYFNSKDNTAEVLKPGALKIINAKGENVELKDFQRFSDDEKKNNFIYPFVARRKRDYYSYQVTQHETNRVSEDLSNLAARIQKIGNPTHPMNKEFSRLCNDILGFEIGVVSAQESNQGIEPGIFTDGTSSISIKSMGEGVANIVGFIALLLTEDNKLYLIEELENDLHPKALKKLLQLIIDKADKNQFVISTHSHIVLKNLGGVDNSKIFYIDWSPKPEQGDETVNVPTSTVKEVDSSPETRIEILEKLGYDFFDYELYSSYLFLEESTAEAIIRDFLIPSFTPKLYNRIKTIAAKGINDLEARVIDFNRLFVFVHTNSIYQNRAWVIADGDDAGQECVLTLQNQFKTWPKEHFINLKSSSFECYYPERFRKQVDEINEMKRGLQKQRAKGDLCDEVMQWSLMNREEAIGAFAISAQEVISILLDIDKQLAAK